jgi:peptidoglycan/LPS O-acetylase OafA/YrhL
MDANHIRSIKKFKFSISHKLDSIESLRGIAALMVLLFHVVGLMEIPLPGSLSFISTHFGLGVSLFFTISGFVLAYGYSDRLKEVVQIRNFYISRFFRIAPLFYAVMIIWMFASWFVWNGTYSLQKILLNMSFLFGLIPGQHQSIVMAGWTIGIEMLFYIVFPVIIVIVSNLRIALISFAIACILSNTIYNTVLAAGLGSYAYENLGTHLPFFMGGVLTFRIWKAMDLMRLTSLGWSLLLVSIVLALMLVNSDQLISLINRFGLQRGVWAIVFGMLILSSLYARNPILESEPLLSLGKLSFSLYLLHPMIMVILIKLDFSKYIIQLTNMAMANFLIASIITIGLVWTSSILSFRFVEVPGVNFGKWLKKRYR